MKRLIYALAFFHLLLISLTIFHALDKVYTLNAVVEKSFSFVCSLNYSVWRYGFFSPDVGRSNEIEIKTYDSQNHETKFSTLNGFNFFLSNADLGKRFYGFKVYNVADTSLQGLSARSVATRMMNIFPDVNKVTYTLRSIRYPTMKDYCKKKPVEILDIYTTTFTLPYR